MPRIRTIKPEFWRNKTLAQQKEFTRLLAIALLNMADDEGYFEADEALIRGDVFPFEKDCKRIHGGLTELSRIGYLAIAEHSFKGKIGLVLAFQKHQVINRPTPSKLRQSFEECQGKSGQNIDSRRTHGGLTEGSVLEREQGTGNREGEQGDSLELKEASKPYDVGIVFDLIGSDPGPYSPSVQLVQDFKRFYPNIDVVQHLLAAAAWHATNPKRRKTRSGIEKFLNGWLSKEANRGGPGHTEFVDAKQKRKEDAMKRFLESVK